MILNSILPLGYVFEDKLRTISFLNAVYNFTGDHIIEKVDIDFGKLLMQKLKVLADQ